MIVPSNLFSIGQSLPKWISSYENALSQFLYTHISYIRDIFLFCMSFLIYFLMILFGRKKYQKYFYTRQSNYIQYDPLWFEFDILINILSHPLLLFFSLSISILFYLSSNYYKCPMFLSQFSISDIYTHHSFPYQNIISFLSLSLIFFYYLFN